MEATFDKLFDTCMILITKLTGIPKEGKSKGQVTHEH